MSRLDTRDIDRAKRVDPIPLICSFGYKVKGSGVHFSVIASGGKEIYRLTRLSDGRFVYCEKDGSKGGDVIELCMKLTSKDFRKAVETLLGNVASLAPAPAQTSTISSQQSQHTPLSIPTESEELIKRSRCYLEWRGISQETILYAEKTGFLRYGLKYTNRGEEGVLFCGYDTAGELKNVSWRAASRTHKDQRNFTGSSKLYPQILRGVSSTVWIVEGGLDALALRDIALRQGALTPIIIVSGGAGVKNFLELDHIQKMLQDAGKIFIARDHEKDNETQLKTDRQHEEQASLIKKITGKDAVLWRPDDLKDRAYDPCVAKDFADLNLRIIKEIRERDQKDQGLGIVDHGS